MGELAQPSSSHAGERRCGRAQQQFAGCRRRDGAPGEMIRINQCSAFAPGCQRGARAGLRSTCFWGTARPAEAGSRGCAGRLCRCRGAAQF